MPQPRAMPAHRSGTTQALEPTLERDLKVALEDAFPSSEVARVRTDGDADPGQDVHWDPDRGTLTVTLAIPTEGEDHLVVRATRWPHSGPRRAEQQFLSNLLRTFASDASESLRCSEPHDVWAALSRTRFQRAVTHLLPRSACIADWVSAMESSLGLRYEGDPARYTLLFRKRLDSGGKAPFRRRLNSSIVRFPEPRNVDDLLLRDKSIRAVVDGHRTGLVATGDALGKAVGLLSITNLRASKTDRLAFAPHISLLPLQHHMGEQGCVLSTSPRGDIYLLLAESGLSFVYRHGSWKLMRLECATDVIRDFLPASPLSVELLRLALDLSFEGNGALLCVTGPESSPRDLVGDYRGSPNRVNALLRDSLAELRLHEAPNAQRDRGVLASAAAMDGATVFDRNGTLRDVGCLIRSDIVAPDPLDRADPGAREEAARRASMHGLAVKVSEDGPIRLFVNGRLVTQIG